MRLRQKSTRIVNSHIYMLAKHILLFTFLFHSLLYHGTRSVGTCVIPTPANLFEKSQNIFSYFCPHNTDTGEYRQRTLFCDPRDTLSSTSLYGHCSSVHCRFSFSMIIWQWFVAVVLFYLTLDNALRYCTLGSLNRQPRTQRETWHRKTLRNLQ